MSIEAMKQVIELYDKHCYNNDYGGIEFNKKHGYKFIEAIESLRTAIQQAEAQQPATSEPVAQWQKRHPIRTAGRWISTDEHDAKWWSEHSRGWEVRPLYTHPAPGVPDDVARNVIATVREQYRGTDWGKAAECICDAIDAAMLAAAQAQKGQP